MVSRSRRSGWNSPSWPNLLGALGGIQVKHQFGRIACTSACLLALGRPLLAQPAPEAGQPVSQVETTDPSRGSTDMDRTVPYPIAQVLVAARQALAIYGCVDLRREQHDYLECVMERQVGLKGGGEKVTVQLSASGSETHVEIKTRKEFWFQLPFGQRNWSTPIFDAMMTALAGTAAEGVTPAHSQADRRRLYVLDTAVRQLTSVSLPTAEVLGRVALEGGPERIVVGPDGTRIVVLERGPGKETARFRYHPTGKSLATVIDTRTLEVVARTELCWDLHTIVPSSEKWGGGYTPRELLPTHIFSRDGRSLTLLCQGYKSQKPEETQPRELVTLDLATGRVVARLTLAQRRHVAGDGLMLSPNGGMVIVYSWARGKFSATLEFVQLEGLTLQSTLTLPGDPLAPIVSPDGRYLYLLNTAWDGSRLRGEEKKDVGSLLVISLETRALKASLDVGSSPQGVIVDDEAGESKFLVLAEAAPSRKNNKQGDDHAGLLSVIHGAEVAASLPLTERPVSVHLAPDGKRVYVSGEGTLAAVNLAGAVQSADLRQASVSWVIEWSDERWV